MHVDVISFAPTRKVWPSLHPLPWNSQTCNSIMFISLIPNFNQTGQQMWKVQMFNLFTPVN